MMSSYHRLAVTRALGDAGPRARANGFPRVLEALLAASERETGSTREEAKETVRDILCTTCRPDVWRIDFVQREVLLWEVVHTNGFSSREKRLRYGCVVEALFYYGWETRIFSVTAIGGAVAEIDGGAMAMEWLSPKAAA